MPNGGMTTAMCCDTDITLWRGLFDGGFDKALGTFSHEVMHIALMHTVRYNDYVAQGLSHEWGMGYNILADLRINEMLKNEGMSLEEGIVSHDNIKQIIEQFGFKKQDGVAGSQIDLMLDCIIADDLTSTDRAFTMFRNYYKYDGEQGDGGQGMDGRGKGKPNPNGNDITHGNKKAPELRDEIERKVVAGLVGSQGQGNDEGSFRRLFEKEYYTKKIDYGLMIRQSLVREMQREISYRTPHKKMIEMDFEMAIPKWENKAGKYHVAVAIDSSGSMGDKTIHSICGELFKLIKSYPVSFDVYVCDMNIRDVFMDIKSIGDLGKIRDIAGGGGTTFKPVFKKLRQLREAKGSKRVVYKTLIYFTDSFGEIDKEDEVKGLKTYWVVDDVGQKVVMPFGKVCMIR